MLSNIDFMSNLGVVAQSIETPKKCAQFPERRRSPHVSKYREYSCILKLTHEFLINISGGDRRHDAPEFRLRERHGAIDEVTEVVVELGIAFCLQAVYKEPVS